MDHVQKGVQWLQRYRQNKLVQTCRYVQRGVVYENVQLTLAHDASTQENDEIIFDWRDQDFLVSPSHFAELGLSEPQRGDLVIRIVGNQEIEYVVTSSGNEPPFRPMSRYHEGWRIHTKRSRVGSLPSS